MRRLILGGFILLYCQTTLAIKQGDNLPDCAAKLSAGEWCEITGSEPSKYLLTKDKGLPYTWGHTGVKSVIVAWTGMATDGQYYYLTGGGHSDYGGNEIYRFDPINNETIQLTPQSPMTHVMLYTPRYKGNQNVNQYCRAPDVYNVPSSTHTYDGIEYSKATNELIVAVYGISNHSCFLVDETDPESKKQLDPYTLIKQNDSGGIYALSLDTLKWRKIYSYSDREDYVIRTEFRDDGMFYFGNRIHLYYGYVNPNKPIEVLGKTTALASAGDGVLVWDEKRKHFWSDHSNIVWKMGKNANPVGRTDPPMTKRDNRNFVLDESNGQFIKWNGSELLRVYTPETDSWCKEKTGRGIKYPSDYKTNTYSWGIFESMQRIYTKFKYVSEYDVFIGINRFDQPWLVHKRNHFCDLENVSSKSNKVSRSNNQQNLPEKKLTLAQRVKKLEGGREVLVKKTIPGNFSIPKNGIPYSDVEALQAMGILPKYALATHAVKPDLDVDWGGQGGERNEIGLFPEQHAAFIAGQTNLKDSILQAALAPPPDKRSDFAHHPNEFWLPYLLTGNPVYIANLEKTWAQYKAWRNQPIDSGIVQMTGREGAWNLRDLTQLAYLEEKGLTTKKVYINALNATRDRWFGIVNGTNKAKQMFNVLEFNTVYSGSIGWTGWMESMLGQVINYTAFMMKDPKWVQVAEWHFQQLIKSSGDKWPLKAVGYDHIAFINYMSADVVKNWTTVIAFANSADWATVTEYPPYIMNNS
ncbi:MAG: hypothetical protein JKY51_08815, partial [Opitutaceae bacterium]|nr:hypothetical protein [Opitutaceae bacterium]